MSKKTKNKKKSNDLTAGQALALGLVGGTIVSALYWGGIATYGVMRGHTTWSELKKNFGPK